MNIKGLGKQQRRIILDLKDHKDRYIRHIFDARDNSEEIQMADDDNVYYWISSQRIESLYKRKLIDVYSDWQPSLVIRIIKSKLTNSTQI